MVSGVGKDRGVEVPLRHVVTDLELLVVRRRAVDDDVSRPARSHAGGDAQRVEVGVIGPAEAQRGRALDACRLAVLADDLGGAGEGAVRRAHALDLADLRQEPGRHPWPVALGDGLHPPHLDRHAPIRSFEDAVEGLVDRVTEDDGSDDEADAEHDRERGQEEPELARQEIPDGLPGDHVRGPAAVNVFMRSRIDSGVGSVI